MRQISSLVLLLLALLVSFRCWAQTPAKEQEQVRVKADSLSYEEQSDTVTATGSVVVTKGETTVNADTIGVNRATNEVTAQGNVVVKDPQGEINADTLHLDRPDSAEILWSKLSYRERRVDDLPMQRLPQGRLEHWWEDD
jgi:lipopolysaccharide assembly outer membrane protein LptD (OstA)